MTKKSKKHDQVYNQEFALFKSAANPKQDAVLTVLRVHLLTEYYLERLIQVFLPRGDRIIEDGSLSYHQKLVLASSFDILDDKTVQCLKGLNKLRNQCAHGFKKKISISEVESLGRPLGKICTRYRRESKNSKKLFLYKVLSYTCGHLTGEIVVSEEKTLDVRAGKKKDVGKSRKEIEQKAEGDAS